MSCLCLDLPTLSCLCLFVWACAQTIQHSLDLDTKNHTKTQPSFDLGADLVQQSLWVLRSRNGHQIGHVWLQILFNEKEHCYILTCTY